MECTRIGELDTFIDEKDIGDFGEGAVYITREFGNTRLRSMEPIPQIPDELGLDDHEVYHISYFFGSIGSIWQGLTNVMLRRDTPLWEAVSSALGKNPVLVDHIGIFNVSEDRTEFSVCWKVS